MFSHRILLNSRPLARVLLVFAAATASCASAPADEAAKSGPTRVLIVTGEDYPGHKWKETSPVLQQQLSMDQRLEVHLTQDLKDLCKPDIHNYDVLVIHFKNYDPEVPGKRGQENLERFVRGGGGMVMVHFACGAFQEWPDFVKIAGRVWNEKLRGHDPHGTFRVEIVDHDHPTTKGLQSFETTDELYTCLDGGTDIHVVADAQSKVDQKRYPMAFVLQYGAGRVFHCVLGHDAPSLRVPAVGELFRRGTAWTAGIAPVAK
jgi:type 1 glutamine amidotransferase